VKNLDKIIELNPNDDVAYNKRGFAKYNLGLMEDAIKDFDQAI
jgi:hypothetical protein